MANDAGDYVETTATNYKDVQPISNDNDTKLQSEVSGNSTGNEAGDRALNIDSKTWGGMSSGAIAPGHKSTQSSSWLENIPTAYREQANRWASQQGVIKVTPIEQRQKFTYSTVAYIADHQEEPKAQIFPITDVQVTPHQINWEFYDTTEGRVGISNAVEKHMSVEFDVYLSDLVAMYWTFGGDNEYSYGLPTEKNTKQRWWNAVENNTYLNFEDNIESTRMFTDFRNNFMQQHNGWVCRFASHTFGVFQGVINDVQYSIGAGESFAKWHIKIEEAIFTEAYSTDGTKPQSQDDSKDDSKNKNQSLSSQTDSGDAPTEEETPDTTG